MDAFPPNSHSAAQAAREPIERVTTAEATRRKPSLFKKFRAVFMGENGQNTAQYVVNNVVVPAIQDLIIDSVQQGIERKIRGTSHAPRRGASQASRPNPYGNVNYAGVTKPQAAPQPRQISAAARRQHDFGEILLESRGEATEVLDRMYDILDKFEAVTVSDLYSLTGLSRTHMDTKWGWDNLHGSGVRRTRSGDYLLDLPAPQYLE